MWLEGAVLHYLGWRAQYTIPISELRLVGEMTTPDGPLLDDYFVCLARNPHEWLEVSIDVPGVEPCMAQLRERLRAPLELGLANSTRYASRILWPISYLGMPMFEFGSTKRAGLFGRCVDWALGPLTSVSMSIDALAAMESAKASQPELGWPPGWQFELTEISPGVYRVRAHDASGRSIERRGTDGAALLVDCRQAAARLISSTHAGN